MEDAAVVGRGQGGFTLIELLIVMVILAVLSTLSIMGIGALRSNASRQACAADVDTYQAAVEAYRTEITHGIPTLSDLVSGGASALITRQSRFVSTMSVDVSGVVSNTSCP